MGSQGPDRVGLAGAESVPNTPSPRSTGGKGAEPFPGHDRDHTSPTGWTPEWGGTALVPSSWCAHTA